MRKLIYSNPSLDLAEDESYGALSWEDQNGNRYHVWVDMPDYNLRGNSISSEKVIFKNPPLSIQYKAAGYYDTRRLKIDFPKNRELVDQMIGEARVLDLFEEAKKTKAKKEEEHKQQALERYREEVANQIRNAAKLFFVGSELEAIRSAPDKEILHVLNISLERLLIHPANASPD